MEGNKHYIRVDNQNRIVLGFSDAFEMPLDKDISINENGGRHFELNGVINPALVEKGIYLFKYENGQVIERTSDEIVTDGAALPKPPKTQLEIMQETIDTLTLTLLGGV